MVVPDRKLVAIFVVTLAIAVCQATGGALIAQEAAQGKPEQHPSTESGAETQGFVGYTGGPSRGKRAITQTTATTIPERGAWSNLPGALLSWAVPPGSTDLINLAFSAECRLLNGGGDDYLRIRILLLRNGVPAAVMEPWDVAQAFCNANGFATYKGNWVGRAGSGSGNFQFQVQVWIFDGAPAEVVSALLDDWTFELVAYD